MRYGPACFEPEGFASGVNLAVQYQQPASKQMMNIYHEFFLMLCSLTFIRNDDFPHAPCMFLAPKLVSLKASSSPCKSRI